MRTIWNMVSFMAVTNLVALLILVGWLWQSGRLDRDRLVTMRELMAVTIADPEADAPTGEEADSGEAPGDGEAARPAASSAQVRQLSRVREQELLARRRLEDQRTQLEGQVSQQKRALDERSLQQQQREERWRETTGQERQEAADRQFAQVVSQLQALPAKQARSLLVQLAETGRFELAVAYLNAMSTRSAARILREFKSEPEQRLATELLEGVRTFGLPAEAAGDSRDAKPVDDSSTADASPARPPEPAGG